MKKITITDIAKELMAKEGYDPHYGARPLGRLIQNKILNPVANFLLSKNVKKDDIVVVTMKDKELMVDMKKTASVKTMASQRKKLVSNIKVGNRVGVKQRYEIKNREARPHDFLVDKKLRCGSVRVNNLNA